MSETRLSNGQTVQQPKVKTTKRAATEQDELAVKLLAAYEQIADRERQIGNLQVDLANLRLSISARERQIVEEKYGLRGNVTLTALGDKRVLTIVTADEADSDGNGAASE